MPAATASRGCFTRFLRLRISTTIGCLHSEQAAQHDVRAAAEETGETDDLACPQLEAL